jgi:CRP-like cAMP-binding protein
MSPGDSFRNAVLASLSAEDRDLLRPRLQRVVLPKRHRLAEANRPIEAVFFLEAGIASVTSSVPHAPPVEVGIVGREGIVNLPILMGSDRSPAETFMQIGGAAYRMGAADLLGAVERSRSLERTLLRCAHVFMVQTASTILANAKGSISERLARWLLMARDRVDGDGIALTHDFVAIMLGVRRAGVTEAVREFERRGLIEGGRGVITILDREGLEEAANGYYGPAERELSRLFPD